jgi:hypothetical protein
MLLTAFHAATPFLSYKANYSFIISELCEFKDSPDHNDCDGFCYLRKQIQQHDDHHGSDHTGNRSSNFGNYSSIYALLVPLSMMDYSSSEEISYQRPKQISIRNIYLEVPSPPPQHS